MDTTNTTKPAKTTRSDRRAANALLINLRLAPIKERRAPRARKDLYTVTTYTTDGDIWTEVNFETLAFARQSCKRNLLDPSLHLGLAAIAKIGAEDALELYKLVDGKVVKTA